jgi:dihydropteroate synthase
MTRVMGILNATPDSFSDGGDIANLKDLERRIIGMMQDGADILDVGGESTRPGHVPVPVAVELERVLPVIHGIRMLNQSVVISIDTQKAVVAEAAIAAGANIVNDVSGFGDPAMAGTVKRLGCPIILMRSKYLEGDVVEACRRELDSLIVKAREAGIPDGRVTLDPGLGFGERPGARVEDNMALVDGIGGYAQGFEVLIGASRKRFIGTMMDEPDARKRVAGSVDIAVRAAKAGASIVRVHDVRETVEALQEAGFRR